MVLFCAIYDSSLGELISMRDFEEISIFGGSYFIFFYV